MLKNYFKTALRSLWRHKTFSIINILGLAVGMTACFLIFLYVRLETSYDDFHSKADRIYRVVGDVKTPSETIENGVTIAPLFVYMPKDFPEIEQAVRVTSDDLLFRRGDLKIQEKNATLADSTFFKVFDFPLIEGNKNTALTAPMSIILSESAVKKYFGTENPMGKNLQVGFDGVNATVT
ncbi:MAG TPA: ABC transporter permease [Puia sp.]